MQLKGITIDFDDRRTCGLLPQLCLQWDEKYDELEDNEDLTEYWEKNIKEILSHTKDVVSGNMGSKAIIYSGEKKSIDIIKKVFKELELNTINYDDIIKCENCLKYDYLDDNFVAEK